MKEKIRRIVDAYTNDRVYPGVCISAIVDDETYIEYGGYSDIEKKQLVHSETRFPIGCIAKVLSAVVLTSLTSAKRSELSLDQPIAEVLPEFRPPGGSALSKITPRHLLTHTSGIDDDILYDLKSNQPSSLVDVSNLVACMGKDCLYQPGRYYSYSTLGSLLAARIIEYASGMPWADAINTFFGIAGVPRENGREDIAECYFNEPGAGFSKGNTDLPPPYFSPTLGNDFLITAHEFATISKILLNRKNELSDRGIGEDARHDLMYKRSEISPRAYERQGFGWGALAHFILDSSFHKSFSVIFILDLKNHSAFTLLANSYSNDGPFLRFLEITSVPVNIVPAKDTGALLGTSADKSNIVESDHTRYTGRYQGNGCSLQVKFDDVHGLHLRNFSHRGSELFRTTDSQDEIVRLQVDQETPNKLNILGRPAQWQFGAPCRTLEYIFDSRESRPLIDLHHSLLIKI